jgi:GAF domain-containing protein
LARRPASDALELLQSQNDEGPCFECYHRATPVISEDLAAETERWPTFAPAAVLKGFLSVHAVPMRVRGETIGSLSLFRSQTGCIAEQDIPLGQGLADIAAAALMQERAARQTRDVVSHLQGALSSRVIIEQAKGVLAERAGIGVDAAFARLRAYARNHNRRLSDVAREITDGRLNAAGLTDALPELRRSG